MHRLKHLYGEPLREQESTDATEYLRVCYNVFTGDTMTPSNQRKLINYFESCGKVIYLDHTNKIVQLRDRGNE